MSDLTPDVVARGRAIFERLRGVPEPPDGSVADETPPAPDQPPDRPVEPPAGDLEEPAERVEEPVEEPPTEPPPVEDEVEEPAAPERAPEPEPVAVAEPAPELVVVAEPSSEAEPEPVVAVEPVPAPEPAPAPSSAVPAPTLPSPPPDAGPDPELVALLEGVESPAPAPEPVAAPPPTALPAPARFARPLPRVVAVANQKGGVGKTTTAVNLAACLADLGHRVLVVDLDPQGNASTGLGINIRDLETSMYDVLLHDVPLEDCVEPTSVRNLFCAPANLDLAGAEIELVPAFSREQKLRTALQPVLDHYDYILVDCPPSLGLLTVNSLTAATEVLVPIQCEYYALEGLGQLMRNVGLVQKSLNQALEVSVIVCVMYDARTKLAEQVVQEVREHFGEKVCRTVIPRTVRLSEAPSYGQPISAFDPTSRGAIAYRELAKEVSGGGTAQRAG